MAGKKKGWFRKLISKDTTNKNIIADDFIHLLEPSMRASLITTRELAAAVTRLDHAILDEDKDEQETILLKLHMLLSVMENNLVRADV